MQQGKQPLRARLQLLARLTLNAGKHTANQPARLAHLDHGNDRAILVQGDEGPAQIVRLGHRGTPSIGVSDEIAILAARPIASLRWREPDSNCLSLAERPALSTRSCARRGIWRSQKTRKHEAGRIVAEVNNGSLRRFGTDGLQTLRWREMDSKFRFRTRGGSAFPPHTVAETSPLADLWFRPRSERNPRTSGEDGGGVVYRDRAQGLGRLVSKRSGSMQDCMAKIARDEYFCWSLLRMSERRTEGDRNGRPTSPRPRSLGKYRHRRGARLVPLDPRRVRLCCRRKAERPDLSDEAGQARRHNHDCQRGGSAAG